jgi:hypothetical protein
LAPTGGATTGGGDAGKVGGAGGTGVGDIGSRCDISGDISGVSTGDKATSDEAAVGVRRLEGEVGENDGGENDGGEAAPYRGERRGSSSSSSPRSNSTSLRCLLVLLAGGEMISGDGGGEAGVQGFLPAGKTSAGAAVAVEDG